MTEHQEKQFDTIKQVCYGNGLFLRQNKKGNFYASQNDSWWSGFATVTMITSGFGNRDIRDILLNDPEEVINWIEYIFRKENK